MGVERRAGILVKVGLVEPHSPYLPCIFVFAAPRCRERAPCARTHRPGLEAVGVDLARARKDRGDWAERNAVPEADVAQESQLER